MASRFPDPRKSKQDRKGFIKTSAGPSSGPTMSWSDITGTPTTLAGYGITGTKAEFDTALTDDNFQFKNEDITGGFF
jgi:hypothetical protein